MNENIPLQVRENLHTKEEKAELECTSTVTSAD